MLENNCSEQSSRMSAMENSTKNAGEMLGKVSPRTAALVGSVKAAGPGCCVAKQLPEACRLLRHWPLTRLLPPCTPACCLQLTLTYNRTRQASITTELIEIISGE